MLIGLGIAYRNYIRVPVAPAASSRMFPRVYRFLMHKWYFDELYDFLFVRPAMGLGRFFWKRGDEQTSTASARMARPMRWHRQPHHRAASSRDMSIATPW